ncbi:hypothetical protein KIL84_022522 [Mauremys mutica]|uniref:Uncharacterized protein n=1 Tax=Mauremys mutica TaxID=74926 RepID=A0A9D3WPI4_9SAUR|nr:hypothetical protein KIL84_022522 [Mauremys mutica]
MSGCVYIIARGLPLSTTLEADMSAGESPRAARCWLSPFPNPSAPSPLAKAVPVFQHCRSCIDGSTDRLAWWPGLSPISSSSYAMAGLETATEKLKNRHQACSVQHIQKTSKRVKREQNWEW